MKQKCGLIGLIVLVFLFLFQCTPPSTPDEKGIPDAAPDSYPCEFKIEMCDGKDNNCDGRVDEQNVCGTVLGKSCTYISTLPTKCSTTCSCLVFNNEKYLCFGEATATQRWFPVDKIAKTCDPSRLGASGVCGEETLLCGACRVGAVWHKSNRPKCDEYDDVIPPSFEIP